MVRIIAFLSQKGGCGKTTACVNLAAALAEMGRRVLIVDLDSNACASLTFNAVASLETSVASALLGQQQMADLIRPTGLDRVWLAPGATNLSAVENMDVTDSARADGTGHLADIALALELEQLDGEMFDYVFIDCPGGNLFMGRLALLACMEVIVPTGLSVYDLYAATPTLQLVLMAQQIRDGQPVFLGFLPNEASKAGVPAKMQAQLDQYEMPCFSPIRNSALLKSITGLPEVTQRVVVLARPDSPVAASFRQVAREIDLGIETARRSTSGAALQALGAP
jgi:chromosome partitioning protein